MGHIKNMLGKKAEFRQILRNIIDICNEEEYTLQTDIQRKIEEIVTNGVGFNSRIDSTNLSHQAYRNFLSRSPYLINQ